MDDRLAIVEETLAHQARTIDELNEVVRTQWREIETLKRELARLEGLIERLNEDGGNDPLPPHY